MRAAPRLVLLCFRVGLALLTSTFFQPDEYYQSLEVAHHAVFGYGYLTWEWTTQHPVRSPVYPAVYAIVYQVVKALGLDDTRVLILAPKVVNGVFASLTDIALYSLTERLIGPLYTSTALVLSVSSFFHALSLARSLSNSAETALTTLAFSYFPWSLHNNERTRLRKCIAFAALACMVRPTNAIIWIFAFGSLASRSALGASTVHLVADLAVIGVPSVFALFAVDTAYYGRPTFTPLNFVKANMAVSSYYGVSSWPFYFVQALPILCTTTLPFVLVGVYRMLRTSDPRHKTLLTVVAGTIAVYSLGPHKEWRFIHPLLPLLHVCAAKTLQDMAQATHQLRFFQGLPAWRTQLARLALLILNIPAILYVMFLHGRAQISVMYYLRGIPPTELVSVGFLMPCHSTPWQSHLHRPNLASTGRMWALTCEPPLNATLETYKDQTDVFYEDPPAYLQARFPAIVDPTFPPAPCPMTTTPACSWQHEWPRFLVLFGALLDEPRINATLTEKGYTQTWHGMNGFEEDTRRRGGVCVWQWQSSP